MKKAVAVFLLLAYLLMLASCAEPSDGNASDGAKPEDKPHVCVFTVESPKPKYIKSRATCTERAQFYYSCSCGEMGTDSFEYGDLAGHSYYLKNAKEEYLAAEATVKTCAVYYKSCKCGKAGEATFEYGEPLRLSELQRQHLPTSLTVTLYDPITYTYGFTYNSEHSPIEPVIQIRGAAENEWREYVPKTYEASTYDENDNLIRIYISEAEITLEPDTEYVYRIGDKGADVFTPESSFGTGNASAESFTFVHASDSQDGPEEFGRVLSALDGRADFVIHTGDVVQNARYEHEWYEMLDTNYEQVMKIPIMAISGNHETAYTGTAFETDKHFHNRIPTQTSTERGYYYSFTYGSVKFIMLNTNDLEDNGLRAEQYDWLISELEGNTSEWTVVSLHNPLYSVGKYGADETKNAVALALRDQLVGVFAEYGVDLVLQGHDHAISRTFPIDKDGAPKTEAKLTENGVEYIVDPEGVIYVMNGPAGTQTRAPVSIDESLYAYAETSKKASFAEIEVTGNTLTVTVKYHTGSGIQVYHTWGIKKTSK